MNNVWGPLHGGNERFSGEYLIKCDDAAAIRLFNLYEAWRQENAAEPDRFTLQATTDSLSLETTDSESSARVTAISLQSLNGDASPKVVMHFHCEDGPMVVIRNVVMERSEEGQIRLLQLVQPG